MVASLHAGSSDVVIEAEKQFLLTSAREVLTMYLTDGRTIDPAESETLSERLTDKKGCFVTLEKQDSGLRGCIGYILPEAALYTSIFENVINAAVHDPRFDPVTLAELDDITISISVLTVPVELAFTSAEDLLQKLVPGRDGVVLKTNYGKATFLPLVWDQLPATEDFLAHLCTKQGAPEEEWQKEGVTVLTYRAIEFSEADAQHDE